mmetsp:Transcript_24427/g.35895  ORF Transcript_24427/g.35895 Transcript_24427/m.35895 type:complete len:507 (-) Transcript_24427:905-2425(-)
MVKSENKMSSKKDYSKGTLNGDIDLPSEEIIRRMKVLSKSQTAFLKAYLHRKLDHAKGLVQKTLEALSSSTDSDELSDLHKQLQKLHLDDIRVDVSSTELMMHEEMELLRKAINKNTLQPSSLPSSVDDGDDSKDSRVKVLESENANLRGLLKELKAELLNAGKRKDGDSPSTPVVDSEQSVKQSKEIERLKKELDQSKKSLQEKDEEVRAALEEVEALRSSGGNTESALAEHKAEIKALKTEMETLKQSSASGAEETGMLKKQIKELQDAIEDEKKATAEQVSKFNAEKKELEHKLQEVQKAAEQEKDDAMEAMTREIEDLVKKHSAETAAQAKETKKLQKALSKYKNSSKSLAGGLGAIRRNASELKASQKRLVTDTRDVIRGVQSEFSTTFTNGILGKLTKLDAMVGEVSKKYRKELSERKRLHNVIQELKGNIRVYLRARPPSAREIEQFGEETVCVSFPENGEVKVFNEKGREKTWEFDEVFDLQATQEKIYSEKIWLLVS